MTHSAVVHNLCSFSLSCCSFFKIGICKSVSLRIWHPAKTTDKLGPVWQNIARKLHIHRQKNIAFSYSDQGGTLEKINQPTSLFSHKEEVYIFKRGQRKCSCIRGQIMPTKNINRRKSICFSRPLSMKQAAKIMHVCSVKMKNPPEQILPLEKKFIGTSIILARGKTHVFPNDPLLHTAYSR